MEEIDRHWLAGLLEGEGSFLKGPPSRPGAPAISYESVDEDIAARVANLLGVTYCFHVARQSYWKDTFTVKRVGYYAVELMKDLRPLMGARRKRQIDAALASAGSTLKRRLTGEECREIARRLNEGENYLALATEYGVQRSSIYNARNKYADVV